MAVEIMQTSGFSIASCLLFYLPVSSCFEMKRPCFGYFFYKYCCSLLVSYRRLPNAKPVAGKKAGKNKLVLSRANDLQTSNTIQRWCKSL